MPEHNLALALLAGTAEHIYELFAGAALTEPNTARVAMNVGKSMSRGKGREKSE